MKTQLDKPVGLLSNLLKTVDKNDRENQLIQIAEISQKIEELYIKFSLISKAVTKLETAADDLEQYGRRNCLILHGFENRDLPNPQQHYDGFLDKIVSIINESFDLDVQRDCIDIAHPLPPSSNGKTPIIKFIRRSDSNFVFRKKNPCQLWSSFDRVTYKEKIISAKGNTAPAW